MKWTLRGTVFSALFAALVVVFGFISIPLGFTPVPVTLQTLAVMLAGGLLGARYGFMSNALVIALTAIGLPMLQGVGGIGKLIGPTGGYVWMWPLAAFFIGLFLSWIRWRGWARYAAYFAVIFVFGALLVYAGGVPWLAHVAGLTLEEAMVQGFYPYLPGDVIKTAVATVIIARVRDVFPPARLTGESAGK